MGDVNQRFFGEPSALFSQCVIVSILAAEIGAQMHIRRAAVSTTSTHISFISMSTLEASFGI